MKIQILIKIEAQVTKLKRNIDVEVTYNKKLFDLCSEEEQEALIELFKEDAEEGFGTCSDYINLDLDVEVDEDGNLTTCKTLNGKELDVNFNIEDKIYDQIEKVKKGLK